MAMNQGIKSKNVVRPSIKTGTGSRGTRPGGAESIGKSYGSHITSESDTGYRGPEFHDGKSFQPVPFGNAVALNVKGGGPGTGRTLYGQSGSQARHGEVAGSPRPKGRDILNNE